MHPGNTVPFQHKVISSLLGRIASRVPSKCISKIDALKIVFLADRYHLRKYGRTITEDTYWAMDYGPVASETKRYIESVANGDETPPAFLSIKNDSFGHQEIKVVGPVDESYLSETDIEATDAALTKAASRKNLVAFTHLFPEWKKHESELNDRTKRLKMDFADFFLSVPKSVEYCDAAPELLALNLSLLSETNVCGR